LTRAEPGADGAPHPAEPELYQDPLQPFSFKDTLVSLLLWPLTALQILLWLALFFLLDKTFLPGPRMNRLVRFANRRITDLALIRVRRHGLERLDLRQSYVYCMNHVSMLDTPVLVQSIPHHARALQDHRHFRIPVYGAFCRMLGQLPINPRDKQANEASLQRALQLLHSGKSVAVFPEGHRTRDGRLAEFYPGAFRLAIEAQVPVLPVVTRGLRNLCPHKEWRFRPGRVDVLFGEPIPTAGLGPDDLQALSDRTFRAMNALLVAGP
jgi:1-acyl-sn-glycerol-3-phosphate acyltransferase